MLFNPKKNGQMIIIKEKFMNYCDTYINSYKLEFNIGFLVFYKDNLKKISLAAR